MNSFILLLCVAAAATAAVGQYAASYVPVSSQYHSQDKFGGFSHGSSTGMQSEQYATPVLYGYAGAAAAGRSAVPQAADASQYRARDTHGGYAYGPSRGPSAQFEPFAAYGASGVGYPYSYGRPRVAEAADVRTPAGTADLFFAERGFGQHPYENAAAFAAASHSSMSQAATASRSQSQDKYAYGRSGGGPSAAHEPRDLFYAKRESGRYPYPAAPVSQYHAQDDRGQYEYGLTDGRSSSKVESRRSDGATKGSYSYPDGRGSTHDAFYTADANGLRTAGTDIPVHRVRRATVVPLYV